MHAKREAVGKRRAGACLPRVWRGAPGLRGVFRRRKRHSDDSSAVPQQARFFKKVDMRRSPPHPLRTRGRQDGSGTGLLTGAISRPARATAASLPDPSHRFESPSQSFRTLRSRPVGAAGPISPGAPNNGGSQARASQLRGSSGVSPLSRTFRRSSIEFGHVAQTAATQDRRTQNDGLSGHVKGGQPSDHLCKMTHRTGTTEPAWLPEISACTRSTAPVYGNNLQALTSISDLSRSAGDLLHRQQDLASGLPGLQVTVRLGGLR